MAGERRHFCCAGCQAVACTILDNGMADYYRHRTAPGGRTDPEAMPELLERFELYDHPDVQRGFVRSGGDWREAFLILEEVRCAACLWLNERHLRAQPGVLDVDVDFTSQRARVRWDPSRTRLSTLLAAIAAIGYVAHPYDNAHRRELDRDQRRRSMSRIIFAAVVGMPVMQFSLATYLSDLDVHGPLPLWVELGRWCMLLAATAVLAYAGQEFFLGAWQDLRRRRLGMDVPIVAGLSAAWLGSLWGTVQATGEVYLDSIVMFVLFVLAARAYELRGRRTAAAAIDRVARVTPQVARRLHGDGSEERVPAVELAPRERIRLRPGEVSPVDGVVAAGSSSFDESLLTGEARPVMKEPGARVVAGSCNREQAVELWVERVGQDSTIGEVSSLLERGLAARPRYAVLAAQAAQWFVAVVIVVAGVTAGTWLWLDPAQALPNTIAVLIVTCPCALALATPVAVAMGAGRFSAAGVLPLDMSALEPLARVDAVGLDKTGTLTDGGFAVRRSELLEAGADAGALRSVVAALERDSSHPLAHAFRQETTPASGLSSLRTAAGEGVEGMAGTVCWRLGTWDYATAGAPLPPALASRLQAWRGEGLTVCVLARDGRPLAVYGLGDRLREGAAAMVAGFAAMGIHDITVLSGDHQEAVAEAAAAAGIAVAHGGLSPADKLAWIRERQAAGRRVLMVGDGINDAPTLAAADASISFAEATHLAQYHSDLLLLAPDLAVIPRALRLARCTRRIVFQNLAWAGGYNLTAIPLAFMGLVPPWAAAIGMSLSSLLVVANAMRLRRGARARSTTPTIPGDSLPGGEGASSVRLSGVHGPLERF